MAAAAVSIAGFVEAGGDLSRRSALHLAAGGLAVMAARAAGLAGDE